MVKRQIWWAYFLLIVLSVADFITTKVLLNESGVSEANPVQHYMIDQYGINGILFFKLFWLLLLAGGILALVDHRYKLMFWAMTALNLLMLVNLYWSDWVLHLVYS